MNSIEIAYFFFGGLTVLSALLMVLTKNLFRAAFLLLICLVSIAGLYVTMQANLLAVVQLLVYAGGVVVLLSFGIMLSNRSKTGGAVRSDFHLVIPGVIVAILFVWLLVPVINQYNSAENQNALSVNEIGTGFMTEYILMFEVIGFLLLVVLVGASFFAKKSSESSKW